MGKGGTLSRIHSSKTTVNKLLHEQVEEQDGRIMKLEAIRWFFIGTPCIATHFNFRIYVLF